MKVLVIALFASAAVVQAAVKLPPLFSDGAVLQRGGPVPVWGEADPGEEIVVEFAGQRLPAVADAQGRWIVRLAPLPASSEPRELVVRGSNTVSVRNVVVGDIWLASGQSNMASPLSSGSAAEALPGSADPLLRFFTVARGVSAEPLSAAPGKWEAADPAVAGNFSAVAYFFARELRRTQDVPVAVINSSWGGTPIRTWMSLASLQGEPPLTKLLLEWESALARHRAAAGQPELLQDYYREMKVWEQQVDAPFRAARKAHEAAVAAAKASGQPVPPAPKPERPEPDMPDPIALPASSKRPSVPTITYNAMIAPLAPFALKGVLWYQGEADVSRGKEYREWLPRLIGGWRSAWNREDLPFLIVQLPGNGRNSGLAGSPAIAFLREAQSMALRLPGTGMAVTLDIGDASDVHPDNKVHVGQRLSLLAREMVYGESISGAGPFYRDHTVDGGEVRIRFDRAGGGLAIGEAPWRAKGAEVLPSDRIVGFTIAGEDRQWFEAEARLDGDSVIVSSPSVPVPAAVRYGWGETPRVNLANREGLPAAPFRTDDWDL